MVEKFLNMPNGKAYGLTLLGKTAELCIDKVQLMQSAATLPGRLMPICPGLESCYPRRIQAANASQGNTTRHQHSFDAALSRDRSALSDVQPNFCYADLLPMSHCSQDRLWHRVAF